MKYLVLLSLDLDTLLVVWELMVSFTDRTNYRRI